MPFHADRLSVCVLLALLFSQSVADVKAQNASVAERRVEAGIRLRNQKQYDRALVELRRAMKNNPSEELAAEILFEMGQVHYQRGRDALDRASNRESEKIFRQALGIFEEVITKYPKTAKAASASYMSGSSYLFLDQPQKALETYQQTFDRYPDYTARSRILVRQGMTLSALDRVPEAITTFKRVIREFPDRKGDVTDARKYVRQLEIVGRKFTPLQADSWLNNLVDDAGLASFEGEVIVLVFLATWCSSCNKHMPRLRRLIEDWSDRGVIVLGALNPKDPKNAEPVDLYIQKNFLEFLDVAFVDDPQIWAAYRGDRLPAAVVIDRRGILRWRGHPSMFPTYVVNKALGE